uniref:Ternary complex factor MIP1 leucine-zipper domain-containing protein n=1 Tax=Manihot esculenta TaxID=3983 RepID=A0A251J8G8_MANES
MCDSSVVQSSLSQSDSTSNFFRPGLLNVGSEAQIDLVNELRCNDPPLEVNSIIDEAKIFGSSIKSNNSFPYRIQLEHDVQRLQQRLQEEMEMHAILEDAIGKNAVKLSCLPHHISSSLRHPKHFNCAVHVHHYAKIPCEDQPSESVSETSCTESMMEDWNELSKILCGRKQG